MVNLLAIDPSSTSCGVAYFLEERPISTDRFRPKGSLPWAERLDYIAAELLRSSSTHSWIPDVVAIEDTVFAKSVSAAITMGKTNGYLMRIVRELYPDARVFPVHPASVRAAMSAPRGRAGAKAKFALVAAAIAPHLEAASEDERDALAIGWAALGKLRLETLERAKGERIGAVP
jgi:Holliday junction resolvasome RuvABC endonuclease subunit